MDEWLGLALLPIPALEGVLTGLPKKASRNLLYHWLIPWESRGPAWVTLLALQLGHLPPGWAGTVLDCGCSLPIPQTGGGGPR